MRARSSDTCYDLRPAAVIFAHGAFAEHSADELDATLAVNLAAPMHLTRLVLPSMLARNTGTVLTMSSMCADA